MKLAVIAFIAFLLCGCVSVPASRELASEVLDGVTPNLNVLTWSTNPTSLKLTGTHGVSLPLAFDGGVKTFQVWSNGVPVASFDMDTTVYPYPFWVDDPHTKVVQVKMTSKAP